MSPLPSLDEPPSRRTVVRVALASVVVLAGLPIAQSFVAMAAGEAGAGHPRAPAAGGPTVVADQTGHLVLYAANGSVAYDEHEYTRYWDVDPVPGTDRTLLVGATERVDADACPGSECRRNVLLRLNLTTGARERLFARTYANRGSNEWHDADRLNDTHLAVAGIKHDRVFVVDTRSDRITWQWNASEHFAPSSGGPPKDWTHLNDVEVLGDGRIMVSIRNQDQVVFVRPGEGVQEAWTLGAENDHDVLHGQHNPDYIPAERGGPAVVVADSHNNRVVEYQRRDGEWVRTWEWQDTRMQWTRDADRLPNGHTLVADTNGDRVLEVDRQGEVVWSVPATKVYEVERLGTGPESAGGPSAAHAGLQSRHGGTTDGTAARSLGAQVWLAVSESAPFLVNSVLYVLPPWLSPQQLLPFAVSSGALLALLACELYWRTPSLAATVAAARTRW